MNNKKISREISLLMGLTMSCVLTVVGLVSSGQFTFQKFLISFPLSFIISLIIGLFIPMKEISNTLVRKCHFTSGTLKARLLEALVTDVLFSPLMTFIMVFMAWKQATAHGARIPFGPMLLRAEIISFIAAFVLGYLVTPVITGFVLKRNGIGLKR